MYHIFLDLECTCWKKNHVRENMETIEIGAVKTDDSLTVIEEYDRFVRPVLKPKLSPFCTRLTSIEQKDVDQAAPFAEVFADFLGWAGNSPLIWYSWGNFDREQLTLDLKRLNLPWGEFLSEANHVNLKGVFAAQYNLDRPVGMMKALRILEVEFAGRHHRAIDDARHVAKIALEINQREKIINRQ
ncbi:MAG: 3'-5' exonuclease [Ardenticatenaceae bacterium]|nr:3'-5' exonuclease [Ardenticatenaceae bacterium]